MSERTLQREGWFASKERRITGERRRSAALETAAHLGGSAAPIVALMAVSDGVAIADRSGALLYANPAWAELTGYAQDTQALLGRPVAELLEPRTSVRTILEGLRHAPTFTSAIGVRHADGSVIPVEVSVSRCIEIEPHTSRFVIVVRRHKVAATAPTALLETIGRLASEIAHDFNNQISVVLNYTFILLRQLKDADASKAHVSQMQTAAWRASQLAQEMLGFGGRRSTDAESIDLGRVAASMTALFRHGGGPTCADVEVRSMPDLWRVRARLPHVEWMLLELALHAQRMLGSVARWSIDVHNEQLADDTPRSVCIVLEASCAPDAERGTSHSSLAARALPEDPAAMPGVELALMHGNGELATTRAGDHTISYRVRLPAEAR